MSFLRKNPFILGDNKSHSLSRISKRKGPKDTKAVKDHKDHKGCGCGGGCGGCGDDKHSLSDLWKKHGRHLMIGGAGALAIYLTTKNKQYALTGFVGLAGADFIYHHQFKGHAI